MRLHRLIAAAPGCKSFCRKVFSGNPVSRIIALH